MKSMASYAVVVPLANEEKDFDSFIKELSKALNTLQNIKVYLIVDDASKDNTRKMCEQLSELDKRFTTVYAPENRNVVDAYLRGYAAAYDDQHDFIIEMDGGLSHDPALLPLFIDAYRQGYDCVFGSRFTKNGSMNSSSFKRKLLSRGGTILSNVLLGSNLSDMTSGYQGFTRKVVKMFLDYSLLSKGHFYQTELRYLLRKCSFIEIPITYKAPSPNVSLYSITNSISVLMNYFIKRITLSPASLKPLE
jgi:dolichol-phosphate mannosyltransferase